MKVLLMSVMLFVVNCERPKPVVISDPVIVPPPPTDQTIVEEEIPEPVLTCGTACLNLSLLDCAVAADTPEGSKCQEICENSFQIPELAWDVKELTNTETCPK